MTSCRLSMRTQGEGPTLILFHGGMGSWRHWIRNIEPLSQHFRVHALDLPGYGDSMAVPRGIGNDEYFDLVEELLIERFGNEAPFHVAGFSFGSVVFSSIASRFGSRVRSLSLIGPSGFGLPRGKPKLPTASYKLAGDDPNRHAEIMRQNLLAVMLLHPESIDEEVLALQAENVHLHKGMNSRHVSVLDVTPANLAALTCPVQLIFGDSDQTTRGDLEARVARCREARPDVEVEIVADTGHWAMFEGASTVNRALLAFHRRHQVTA